MTRDYVTADLPVFLVFPVCALFLVMWAGPQRGTVSGERELFVARVAAVVVGTTATMLAVFARSLNVSFLIGLAFAVAASALVPALLYSLFWKDFTTRGAIGASTAV